MSQLKDQFFVGLQVLIALILMTTFLPNKVLTEMNPHPFFIVILYGALASGPWAGVFTGAISSLLYLCLSFYAVGFSFNSAALSLEGFMEFLKVYPSAYFAPLLFLIVGYVVGETRLSWHRRLQHVNEQMQLSQKEMQESTRSLQKAEEALLELQGRILGQTASMLRLYQMSRNLNALSVEKIFSGVMDVLEDLLQVEQASIYRLDENGRIAQLLLHKGESVLPNLIEQNSLWQRTVSYGKVLSFVDVEQGEGPIYMVPIHVSRHMYAMIVVHRLPRIKVNSDSLKLLSIIADWTGASLERVYSLEPKYLLNGERFDDLFKNTIVSEDEVMV
ncbi:GAF domain-containing protein [Ectobacillus panaciterrae]|uniref:GAF domain-containing protein n=1 Tax=Ectobacillus panaciterrae TaxID=363872 RepID=UPI00040CC65E|nr:GAF domain-containing protein [Ectobacillus panaciterrae]